MWLGSRLFRFLVYAILLCAAVHMVSKIVFVRRRPAYEQQFKFDDEPLTLWWGRKNWCCRIAPLHWQPGAHVDDDSARGHR